MALEGIFIESFSGVFKVGPTIAISKGGFMKSISKRPQLNNT
jgi:hypothetical protein